MGSRIGDLLKSRGLKVASFARDNEITPTTLYAIVKGETKMENISIGTFLKIAEGLDMTAEELYYGASKKSPKFEDPMQTALNSCYESMNSKGRERLVDEAEMLAKRSDFAKSEDHRVSKTA